jgi:hypothetical protein
MLNKLGGTDVTSMQDLRDTLSAENAVIEFRVTACIVSQSTEIFIIHVGRQGKIDNTVHCRYVIAKPT